MWRATKGGGSQQEDPMTIKSLTSGLQTLYVHETHCTGWSQTPGYDKLFRDAGVFGQVNQSLIVEINGNFAEVCHERDGRHQEPGKIKRRRDRSRLSQVHLESGPWIIGLVGEITTTGE